MKTSTFCYSQKQHSFKTNIVKKLFPFILILILPILMNAQTDFRPGFYITWDNDTIFGLVDYRGEIRNSRFCSFKENDKAETIRIAPSEIKAYRFLNDKYYVSKEIETDGEKAPFFLEILVDGITNLFYMRTTERDVYFIEKMDGSIYTLVRDISTDYDQEKGTTIRESYKYIGLLKLAFADCWEIQPFIKNAKLSHQSLIDLTEKYHDCVCDDERCIIYEKKLPALKVQVAPVVGMGISTLGFKGGFFSMFKYDPHISPAYGILLTVTLPRTNGKLSFEAETIVKDESFYGSYNDYFDVFIKTKKIQPSFGIKYNFPKGKIRPTLSAGGFGSYLKNTKTKTVVTVENIETVKEDAYVPFVNTFYGLYFQFGCNYHILKNREAFTNLKIMHGSAVYDSNVEELGIKNTFSSVYFNLGFYLGKRK